MKRAAALLGAVACVLACWWIPILAAVLSTLRAVFQK